MLVEKDGLWYQILKARYKEEGRLKEGGRESSMWWRIMYGIRSGVSLGVGSWFEDNVHSLVGGRGNTYFWTVNWVGGVPLRVRFPHLFELPENRWVMVEDIERRGWEDGGDGWFWQRRLLYWEKESITKCSLLLHDVVLQAHIHDKWRWLIDPIHGYSVKGTYHYLMTVDTPSERGLVDNV